MNNRWHYFKVRRSNDFESWSRVFRLASLGFISLRDAHECVSCKVFSMINHTLRGLPFIDVTVAKHVRLRQAGDAQKGGQSPCDLRTGQVHDHGGPPHWVSNVLFSSHLIRFSRFEPWMAANMLPGRACGNITGLVRWTIKEHVSKYKVFIPNLLSYVPFGVIFSVCCASLWRPL